MTRKERLDWLYRLRSKIYVYMPNDWIKPMDDALTESIKALEQQQNIHDTCKKCVEFSEFEQQPSVTPSRPKGKWIHWTDDYKDYVTCSCCEYGEEGEVLLSDKTPFCPICGADMREGAE